MKKISILLVFISIIACNQKKKTESTNDESISKKESIINASLKKMYYGDSHNKYPLEDTLIFSKEIVELNRKCDSVTKTDAKRIAKSNYPTDKPLLREGSRISSFYEGVTDFIIKDIKTIGNKTEVTVSLSNKLYPDTKQWNEKIVFIKQNDFKIDNIYFDIKNPENSNLKKSLLDFVKQLDES